MIFTGIEVLFFSLGVLCESSILLAIYYNKKFNFNKLTWAFVVLGIALMIFAIAWSSSSVLEGEPRAASMGLLVFGLPGIIFTLLGRKYALKNILK